MLSTIINDINHSPSLLQIGLPALLLLITSILFFIYYSFNLPKKHASESKHPNKLPRAYPIIGCFFQIFKNRNRHIQWVSEILNIAPSSTFVVQVPFNPPRILTANPSNFQHFLKTRFHIYQKGESFRTAFFELFGNGLFLADGKDWKLQRQLTSHEYNSKYFHDMVRSMMDMELINRLYPILATAAENKTLLDLQEILRRFSFDVVFQNLFGYDLQFLSPGHVSNTTSKFADAFTHAVQIGSERYVANISALPILWRVKRFLNIGSEKQFKMSVNEARGFIGGLIKKRKEEKELVGDDVLTRLLISGWTDEKFVLDLLICLLLAGQEAISTALTWFFWVISANPEVEIELVKEILSNGGGESNRDEVNGGGGRCMGAYTRASLSECLRLYPPVPVDTKEAMADDVWPDGTIVKKGMKIVYHIYAMGRSKEVWGSDFAEFRPERWLERDGADGKMWRFVARGDSYSNPVFQAGPRICLGREIAFMQMEKVVAGVLSQFRVVPAVEGFQPEYISYLTSKMKGGFPVRLERRSKGDL